MAAYYKILFQKMKEGAPVVESKAAWNIVCQEFPFKTHGDVKALPSHSWSDKDGVDEYIPDKLFVDAYELEVSFVLKCASGTGTSNISSFVKYLTGNDGTTYGATLKVYDTYTKIGRQNVRFISGEVEEKAFNETETYINENGQLITWQFDLFVIKVKFKVNDPTTDITLTAP